MKSIPYPLYMYFFPNVHSKTVKKSKNNRKDDKVQRKLKVIPWLVKSLRHLCQRICGGS